MGARETKGAKGIPKVPQRTAKGSQWHPKGTPKDGQREPKASQRETKAYPVGHLVAPFPRANEANRANRSNFWSLDFVRRHRANDRFARRKGERKTGRESGEGSYINKLPINRKAAIYLYEGTSVDSQMRNLTRSSTLVIVSVRHCTLIQEPEVHEVKK